MRCLQLEILPNTPFHILTQHWSNISTSIGHSVKYPQGRTHHAVTHLSGPSFVIVGGLDQRGYILNDMWLCDTTTKLWKKVLFLFTILSVHKEAIIYIYVNSLDDNINLACANQFIVVL